MVKCKVVFRMLNKIKDLFNDKKQYVCEYKVSDKYLLYIEGLDENGECILGDFDINNIKNVIVELHGIYKDDYLDYIDSLDGPFKLDTNFEDIIKETKEIIERIEE